MRRQLDSRETPGCRWTNSLDALISILLSQNFRLIGAIQFVPKPKTPPSNFLNQSLLVAEYSQNVDLP